MSEPAKTRSLLILLCVSAPSFMLQLDANIVSVSLPSIAQSLRDGDGAYKTGHYRDLFAEHGRSRAEAAERMCRRGLEIFILAFLFRSYPARVESLKIA